MAEPGPLDLREAEPQAEKRIQVRKELPPYSAEWARIVKPVSLSLLGLIAAVMLLPFLIVVFVSKEVGNQVIDWAKTVLPPVVGFGGALVGYYFGTRGSQQDQPPEEEQDAQ